MSTFIGADAPDVPVAAPVPPAGARTLDAACALSSNIVCAATIPVSAEFATDKSTIH